MLQASTGASLKVLILTGRKFDFCKKDRGQVRETDAEALPR